MDSHECTVDCKTLDNIHRLWSNWQFFWYGQRYTDHYSFRSMLPVSGIICCDSDQEASRARREGRHVFSLEEMEKTRYGWSSSHLEYLPVGEFGEQVKRYLLTLTQPLGLICYNSSAILEHLLLSSRRGSLILANPAKLKHELDDKILFRDIITYVNCHLVPGQAISLENTNYATLKNRYGSKMVVQSPNGSAGTSAYIIENQKDILKASKSLISHIALVTKYLDSIPINVHGLVLEEEVLVSPPSVQLIGIPELTRHPLGYCGNDFGAASVLLPQTIKDSLYAVVQRIGHWLAKSAYRGIFGLDCLSADGLIYPLEINPRLQGSTPMLTQLQCSNRRLPFTLLHIAEFLKCNDIEDIKRSRPYYYDVLEGTQLIAHNIGAEYRFNGQLKSGVYTIQAGELKWVKEGKTLKDISDNFEFVISGLPISDTIVKRDAGMYRLLTKEPVLFVKHGIPAGLSEKWQGIVALIASQLGTDNSAPSYHDMEHRLL